MRDRRTPHIHRIGLVALLLAGVLLVSAAIAVAPTAAQPVPPVDPLNEILIQQNTILNALSDVTQNWDKNLPAAQRFVILAAFRNPTVQKTSPAFAGTAVLDRNTGLVWERAPDAINTYTWSEATIYCLRKAVPAVGGAKGWRLPSVAELASLQDPSLPVPFVPTTVFIGVRPLFYWSATTVADNPTSAWDVTFGGGGVASSLNKINKWPAWCVRGGMNADTY